MDDEPQPIGEAIEPAILKMQRPDLLDSYLKEKERHREELKAIEEARKKTRAWIWQCFRRPLREQKCAELEAKHLERVRGEEDRHARFMNELRKSIRDHLDSKRE